MKIPPEKVERKMLNLNLHVESQEKGESLVSPVCYLLKLVRICFQMNSQQSQIPLTRFPLQSGLYIYLQIPHYILPLY